MSLFSPRILDLSFQAAVLRHMGSASVLAQAVDARGWTFPSDTGLEQVETVEGLVAQGIALEDIEEVVGESVSSLQGGYRQASVASDAFRRERRLLQYDMIGLPGGWTVGVRGDAGFSPHWVRLDPYYLGKAPLTRGYFLELLRLEGLRPTPPRWSHRLDEPVTGLSGHQYEAIPKSMASFREAAFRLPRRIEWEAAARGPAVEVSRALREEYGSFQPKDFKDLVNERFEFFFFEMGGEIFEDPRHAAIQKRLKAGLPVFGYRRYATVSGCLAPGETPERWQPTPETTPPVSVTALHVSHVVEGGLLPVERNLPLSLIAPAHWGPTNVLGFHQMLLGVLNLVRDDDAPFMAKGGSLFDRTIQPVSYNTAFRWGDQTNPLGIRLAAFV